MKILLADDGSKFAHFARELLKKWPFTTRPEVIVAGVTPAPGTLFGYVEPVVAAASAEQLVQAQEEIERSMEHTLEHAVQDLAAAGFQASAKHLHGDAASELLDEVNGGGYDWVVIGSHGKGGLESLLLGSVARRLTSHARCTVLIAKANRENPQYSIDALLADKKLSIVVGTDGSSGAQLAVETVRGAADSGFESILVLVSSPLTPVPAGMEPSTVASYFPEDIERAEELAKSTLHELAHVAGSGKAATSSARASAALVKASKEQSADVVVVGAKGHSGLERFLLGSVSFEVVNEASCSVLVVR